MKRKLLSLAVASAIVGAAALAPAPAFAQSAEIEALKAQLAALSAKIEQLEKAQTQTKKTVDETQATADKTADVVAQEKSRLSFAGDLRYRNESFDVQYVDRNRQRDRIRARLNANFRVNDTITGQLGIATGGTGSALGQPDAHRSELAQGLRARRRVRHVGAECEVEASPPASSVIPGSAPPACSSTTT